MNLSTVLTGKAAAMAALAELNFDEVVRHA